MNASFERVSRRETTTTEIAYDYATGPTPKASILTRSVTRYAVTGVEAVPKYDEGCGRLYVPLRVTVAIVGGGNPSVIVLGCLQRKDGSLGVTEYEIHRYGWRRADWPGWLIDIATDAASTSPRGDVP